MKRYRLDETLLESESGAWVRYDDHMKEVSEREHTLSRIRSAIGCAPYDSTLAVIDQMVRENAGLRKPAQEELATMRKALVEEKQRHQSVIDAHTKLRCHAWYCTIQLAGGVCNCPQQIFQFNGMKERYARERAEIQDAFAPVLSWYQAQGGEQSPRTLGAMIADAVADLIKDRKDALKLKAAEAEAAQQKRNAEHIGKCNEELSRENERLKKQSEADVKWAAHWGRQLAVLREMCGGTSLGNAGDDAIVVGAWIKNHSEESQPALHCDLLPSIDRLREYLTEGMYMDSNGEDFRVLADAILELADSLSKGEQK